MIGGNSVARRFLPPLVVMAIIFTVSHQPGDQLSLPAFPGSDKLAHAAAYGLLALTLIGAFSRSTQQSRPGLVVGVACLWSLAYGLSDEFHQSFVPGRSVSGFDVLADLVGALLVGAVWLLYRRSAVRQEKKEYSL